MSNSFYTLDPMGFLHLYPFLPGIISIYFSGMMTPAKISGDKTPKGCMFLNVKEQVKHYPEPGRLYHGFCFYSDPKGNIWVGTNEGVVIYSQSTTYFNRYLSGQDPPYSCRGFYRRP